MRRASLKTMAILIVALSFGAWSGLALAIQTSGLTRAVALGTLLAFVVSMLGLAIRGQRGLAVSLLTVGIAVTAAWWASIKPSNDRDWAEDVAHGVTASVEGDVATLMNVRAFDWRSDTDYTARWETRRYALGDLTSLDLISSVWDSPAIAHTLMSFGFADGGHVVFSAEIRCEKGEAFSAIGGFFKEFELVMIAAEESDIVRLRTTIRGETVSLFPLKLQRPQIEALFRAYLDRANQLAGKPEFYETATTNCTTVIYHLAKLVEPTTPWDWRILVSGYLPGYLYDHRLIATDKPLSEVEREAMITPRGQKTSDPKMFSQAIRTP